MWGTRNKIKIVCVVSVESTIPIQTNFTGRTPNDWFLFLSLSWAHQTTSMGFKVLSSGRNRLQKVTFSESSGGGCIEGHPHPCCSVGISFLVCWQRVMYYHWIKIVNLVAFLIYMPGGTCLLLQWIWLQL
jgi:hypothetical protein